MWLWMQRFLIDCISQEEEQTSWNPASTGLLLSFSDKKRLHHGSTITILIIPVNEVLRFPPFSQNQPIQTSNNQKLTTCTINWWPSKSNTPEILATFQSLGSLANRKLSWRGDPEILSHWWLEVLSLLCWNPPVPQKYRILVGTFYWEGQHPKLLICVWQMK